ncbi:ABC transporter substrate-binding protein [Promicromonospora sp. NPDC057488]|uniref:ABC transporter substrate-binding protein n=1 Tax=Promicromonospora sp. NPDC057488 TaxID=3346147 RepID=UPI0036707A68
MRQNRRTIAIAALTTMAVLLVSACGGGAAQDTGGAPDGTKAPTGGDPVTITYLHRLPEPDGAVSVKEITDRWNAEHPDIQVEASAFLGSADEMGVRLEADIKAGVGPCLAQVGYSELPEFYVRGLVSDVTKEAAPFEQYFSPGSWAAMNVGGAQLGVPQDAGPMVFFYDAAEFERLGIEVPTTPEEFVDAARVVAADGKFMDAFSADNASIVAALSAAAGDKWFNTDDDQWRVETDGPGSRSVAAFYQQLLDDDLVLRASRWSDDFAAALNEGTLVGYIGAGWNAGFMLDAVDGSEHEGDWRIAPIPDFGAGGVTAPDGGSGVAVMSGCEHPAEAMAFNGWLNQQVDDLATQGLITVSHEVPKTSERSLRQFGGQDVMKVLVEATGDLTTDFQYAPGMEAMFTAMQPVLADAAEGDRPVADALSTARETAVARLLDVGLPVAE